MPFRLPTHVYFGPGSCAHIDQIIQNHNARHVLLITDAGLSATHWPETIETILRKASLEVTTVNTIEANPRFATIDTIAAEARAQSIDVVLGLGGGSVLDAGKTIAMLLQNPGSCLEYEGKNIFKNGSAPFVAIPTTCGTGSEVTWVSVISNPDQQRKISIKGEAMFPEEAVVDPDVLVTLPSHLIASTGMDAFTHAIEAYTGLCANPWSDALCEKAIMVLDQYLVRAFRSIEEDAEARSQVMRSATMAGMAFGNADVAGVHCLSESLGGLYDIPHGLGNTLLLLPVLKYHRPVISGRLTELFSVLRPESAGRMNAELGSQQLLELIAALIAQLDVPPFDSLGIPKEDYPRIAMEAAQNNSNASNPQPMDKNDYLAILESI